MKQNTLLLPNRYKAIGWLIFLLFTVLGFFCILMEFKIPGFQLYHGIGGLTEDYNLTNELAVFGVTMGLLMIVFAKEKCEDEYISMLRLKSLQWAVLLSYMILIVLNFSVYGLGFLMLLIYNMWTTLIVFIIKFNWSLYKLRKETLKNEK